MNMPYFPYNRAVTFPYKRSGTVLQMVDEDEPIMEGSDDEFGDIQEGRTA